VAHLLVHVEQYDVVGVLPSQLESLALASAGMGIDRRAFVDATLDGVRPGSGFERFTSLDHFLSVEDGPLTAFTPDGETDVRDLKVADDEWMIFGPAMGLPRHTFGDRPVRWASIPVGVLNSRDAAAIAMWEVSSWRAQ
jgi:tRNA(Leu) C34 or U34 (ribose-2'-O)-methylase TrmL